MANHPQAIKRLRQSLKRKERNRHYTSKVRSALKNFNSAIEGQLPLEEVQALSKSTSSLIDKVAGKGIIKAQTAARKISRLALAVNRYAEVAATAKPAKKATAKKSAAKSRTKTATAKKSTAKAKKAPAKKS